MKIIKLHKYSDRTKMRINVDHIVCYYNDNDNLLNRGGRVLTTFVLAAGAIVHVEETVQEIDEQVEAL